MHKECRCADYGCKQTPFFKQVCFFIYNKLCAKPFLGAGNNPHKGENLIHNGVHNKGCFVGKAIVKAEACNKN